ncbi:molecular chaperone [Klebsiella sp. RHBSTW-00215]|nr:molecular chaperone [Klebsiella sp. RHBSTW-00215]
MMIKYLLPFICTFCFSVEASVVMQGNRVIYDASKSQKPVTFTNNDSFPYIVQTWVSAAENTTASEAGESPFAISPAVFKINSHQDQIISLIYTNAQKKLSKEQIFYLHFTQVPSILEDERNKNKLVLIVNSVVKIFLRPDNLPISYEQMLDFINYKITNDSRGCSLIISNQSPYYLNSISLTTTFGSANKEIPMQMIAPNSTFSLPTNCNNTQVQKSISVSYINDYGVVQKHKLKE